jgi:hypothetical protein
MSFQIAVSDALNRRVPRFEPARYRAFQLAVADIAKGRARGNKVHTAPASGRVYYELKRGEYSLYYSVDPQRVDSLVFEEFLSEDEQDLIMEVFAEGSD